MYGKSLTMICQFQIVVNMYFYHFLRESGAMNNRLSKTNLGVFV